MKTPLPFPLSNTVRAVAALLAIGSLAVACAAASGYDPKRYAETKVEPPDPDTQPLPSEPKPKIPDPKSPVAAGGAAATPAPAPTPEPSAASAAAPSAKPAGSGSAKVAAAAPPKPATPAPPAGGEPAADCGSKENPCPMQKFMKGQMTAAQTPEALEAAFTRVAGLSPNGGWAWASIAKKGAELAKAGDVPGAKAQCKACHDQHKDAYKKQYRARKF